MRYFDGSGAATWGFMGKMLVHCPRCHKCAKVLSKTENPNSNYYHHGEVMRLVCNNCAFYEEKVITDYFAVRWGGREAKDWVFKQPLWLQRTCCGNKVLWAFNQEHLDYLEKFVSAGIRDKSYHVKITDRRAWFRLPSKLNAGANLPSWVKEAKNRDEILKVIARLRQTLVEG